MGFIYIPDNTPFPFSPILSEMDSLPSNTSVGTFWLQTGDFKPFTPLHISWIRPYHSIFSSDFIRIGFLTLEDPRIYILAASRRVKPFTPLHVSWIRPWRSIFGSDFIRNGFLTIENPEDHILATIRAS